MTDPDAPPTSPDWLAARFEEQRGHLRAVAYRMLGSMAEADDTVQDAWLRVARADATAVDNLRGWLTTIVARLSLDRLRARASRREDLIGVHMPDPIVESIDSHEAPGRNDPEQHALLADSVGLAMLVVLETLSPPERLAFVLHDTFGLSFEEIAPIVDRSPTAARQLASRARRRVRGSRGANEVSRVRQRQLVDAFLAAARGGDFAGLLRILDPDVVIRADTGGRNAALGPSREIRGAEAAARSAMSFRTLASGARLALVNGQPGYVVRVEERPFAILAFAFASDAIVEIDILADPARLARLDLAV